MRSVNSGVMALTILVMVHLQAQEPRPYTAAELRERVEQLGVLGSVLYVGAHPDDENTAFLATMVHGRHVRTAYLSMTRGEGGQNLIGPEQGALLGLIRTQELLAARRIDGATQYFTRSIDFGYSKSTQETIDLWGRDSVLSDVVHVIRRFRPDVIVTRFTPEQGTHGNHTASAVFARLAFDAAADPDQFTDGLRYPPAWRARRLMWNVFRFSATDRAQVPPGSVTIDLGGYSPLLGRSYSELAGEARTMHKSQGFGAAQNRGEFINALQHVAGDSARSDLFDGVDLTWNRVKGGAVLKPLVDSLRRSFDDLHPDRSVPLLLTIQRTLRTIPIDHWTVIKQREVADLIIGCAGIWLDVLGAHEVVIPGDSTVMTLTAIDRSGLPA